MAEWWKRAVGYQVYPRSFADSDGDGVGDIPGILSRLDYLADLGIGMIWLSPVFASPMADNGYDISDYRAIAPVFGRLEDFDRLVAEARARGIGIVMDLVVNHSSDEHEWFQNAKQSRSAKYRDFYIWRDPAADGGPPNDLQSFFGGPAWTLSPETGQYYLHLFHRKQPDLNWENPALRAAVYRMMNWWLDRGIAGFRMDVIDLIGKEVDRGILADGPRLHDYLREMHEATLAGRDVVTVGEAWSASPDNARLYSGAARGELSMVFQFGQVTQGWDPVFGKWRSKPRHLPGLKRIFNAWQAALAEDGWNSLFWSNHDLPRAVSKYGDDSPEWRPRSAKALATVLHLMKGTPWIYQGEEIGMTNARRARLEDFDDVEVHGQWPEMEARGMSEAEFIAGANANGRDNARTPMQWDGSANAGFTTGTPWLAVNPNCRAVNVAADRADPEGIFAHYQRLVALRQELDIIVAGRHLPLAEDHPAVWAYARELGGDRLTVVANLSGEAVRFALPPQAAVAGRCLVHNAGERRALAGDIDLAPWEAFAVLGPA
jgi:oligo-1,6-glucosidase